VQVDLPRFLVPAIPALGRALGRTGWSVPLAVPGLDGSPPLIFARGKSHASSMKQALCRVIPEPRDPLAAGRAGGALRVAPRAPSFCVRRTA
jgi:hypothetical protein